MGKNNTEAFRFLSELIRIHILQSETIIFVLISQLT